MQRGTLGVAIRSRGVSTRWEERVVRRGHRTGPVGVLAVLGISLWVLALSPPAEADCVYVDFHVTTENAPPIYPAGSDPCRYPTTWPTVVTASPHFTHTGGKPTGTPNGFNLEVRIPLP